MRFLQHILTGTHTAFGKNVPNFADECRKLITLPETSGLESLRIIIPRALVFLTTIRGKRGIGHPAGDVDANRIDVEAIIRIADWIICELIRIYHGLSLEDAQDIIDSLAIRELPSIWAVAGKKRVLKKGLSFKDQVLLLLYSDSHSSVLVEDVYSWVEHSNFSVFKRDILQRLHKERLLEYDSENDAIQISPLGIHHVQKSLLK